MKTDLENTFKLLQGWVTRTNESIEIGGLSENYGDHCYLGNAVDHMMDKVEQEVGEYGDRGATLNRCKGITTEQLIIGKSILGNTIKEWTKQKRDEADKNSGSWRIKWPWKHWGLVCKQKREQPNLQQQRKNNAAVMTEFMKMKEDNTHSGQSSQPTLSEVLIDDKYKLKPETLERALAPLVNNAGAGGPSANIENLIKTGEGDTFLDKLPSRKVYNKFKDGACYTTYRTSYAGKEEQLKQKSDVLPYAKKIMNAWCYIPKVDTYRLSKYRGELCNSLYYYIASLLPDTLRKADFIDRMNYIGNALKGDWYFNNCDGKYPVTNTDRSILLQRKILFDYKFDHTALQKLIKANSNDCNNKYGAHLAEIESAYKAVSKYCQEDSEDYDYCKAFTRTYGKYFMGGKPTLTCPTKGATKQVAGKPEASHPELVKPASAWEDPLATSSGGEEDDDDLLDDLDLDDFLNLQKEGALSGLPSRKDYYNMFDRGVNNCRNYNNWPQEMKVALEDDPDIGEGAEKIAKGLCHAYETKKNSTSHKLNQDYCDFYYFWVGGKILRELNGGKDFKSVMKKIKEEVEKKKSDHGCSFRFPTERGINFFLHSKILFDYYKDHESINPHLKIGGKVCANAYYRYLLKAQNAYTYMKDKCENGGKTNNKEWCEYFKEMYKECRNGEHSTLSLCKVGKSTLGEQCATTYRSSVTEERTPLTPEGSTYPEGDTTNNRSTIPPATAISGILYTIGLPALGLFLYKYTDLFDGIKKYLFGGSNNTRGRNRGRGRRATFRHNHQHFDSYFDSSTIGDSTEGVSTLGSTEGTSTIDGTVYSIPYYTEVFSGMHDNFGGGNNISINGRNVRRGRSRLYSMYYNHFDDSSTIGDSNTVYSTDVSTVDGSTTMESTSDLTEDTSTIYNEGRGRSLQP
ncbi:KIR protein [Plasmodium knowlesi strain H]|nr:KIR protein [Plasmodium knowlesi strain H]